MVDAAPALLSVQALIYSHLPLKGEGWWVKPPVISKILAEIPLKWGCWVRMVSFLTLFSKLEACRPVPTSTANLPLPLVAPLEYEMVGRLVRARALQSDCCGQFQLLLVMWPWVGSLNFQCFDGPYFGNKSNNSTYLTRSSWEINEIMNIEYFNSMPDTPWGLNKCYLILWTFGDTSLRNYIQ